MPVDSIWLARHLVLWSVALGLGFLLVGALQALRIRGWRVEQLEIALCSRLGLTPGTSAPAFSLPSVQGARITLRSFTGRRVLLAFTNANGQPWRQLLPELNRLQRQHSLQVLLIETGGPQAAQQLVGEGQAAFPVLLQQTRNVVKRFRVPAMPFAFLIDEQGVIASEGIINNAQHICFVLSGAGEAAKSGHAETKLAAEVGVS
jgi:methylamine dehydrogenase accessory protein MauD